MSKKGRFQCSRCGRSFAMAAHLGRHTSTMHAPQGGSSARRAVLGPARGLAMGRPGADGRGRLLQQLQASRTEIAAQAAALDAQLAALDSVLTLLGGVRRPGRPPRAGGRPRAARAGTLRGYIEQVLRAQRGPVLVRDLTAAVLKAGFKSRDTRLAHTVGKCLVSMPGVGKVGRGLYRLK